MKNQLVNLIEHCLTKLEMPIDNITVSLPKHPGHGDFSSNIAMILFMAVTVFSLPLCCLNTDSETLIAVPVFLDPFLLSQLVPVFLAPFLWFPFSRKSFARVRTRVFLI